MLTFEQIKELIELVAQRGLQGIEVERSGFRLKIDGHRPAPMVGAASPPSPIPGSDLGATAGMPAGGGWNGGAAAPAAGVAAAPSGSTGPAGAAEPAADSHVVTSPIVGTFYSAPSPDADPFVEVGSRVKKGQVLCIIEAMKLMNEIESDVDGTVLEVFPQNAQAVEFGEPLFRIRTT